MYTPSFSLSTTTIPQNMPFLPHPNQRVSKMYPPIAIKFDYSGYLILPVLSERINYLLICSHPDSQLYCSEDHLYLHVLQMKGGDLLVRISEPPSDWGKRSFFGHWRRALQSWRSVQNCSRLAIWTLRRRIGTYSPLTLCFVAWVPVLQENRSGSPSLSTMQSLPLKEDISDLYFICSEWVFLTEA